LRQESEHACDDTVVSIGVPGAEYASHLLDLAREAVTSRTSWSPALAIARSSSLEGRIRAMLNARLNRTPLTPLLGAATALFCAAATLPLAGFTTMPAATPLSARVAAVDQRTTPTPAVKVVRFSVLDRGTPRSGQFTPTPRTGAVVGDTLAQTAFASFTGQIADPSGGLLPGVTLRLSNRQSGAKQEVRSDRRGRFEFVGLPAGDYALDAVLAGFSNFRETVTFAVGQAAEQNITMQIGAIEETLLVTDGDAYPADYGTQTHAGRGRGPGGEGCNAPVTGGIGGSLKPPARIYNVRPVYPVGSREARVEGTVTMQGRITTSGFVADVRTVDAPAVDLASAATDAISGWRFEPTLLNCQPIDTAMTVRVKFQLAK
jgi:TonB family protein